MAQGVFAVWRGYLDTLFFTAGFPLDAKLKNHCQNKTLTDVYEVYFVSAFAQSFLEWRFAL